MFKLNKSVAVFFAMAFCVMISFSVVNVKAEEKVVRDGVSVESVDISGMTGKEAKKAVQEYVDGLTSVNVSIKVSDKTVDVTVGELGYKWANTGIIDEALEIGKRGNVIQRYKDELDIENKGKEFSVEMKITKEDIIAALEGLCDEYSIEAQNASIKLTSSGFEIIPEEDGVAVNYETTSETIYKYITEEWDKKSEISIEADTKVDEPKYTTADMEKISDVPMGSYTTTFATGSSYYNRNMNILNGAKLLDHIMLYPGEEYSLNEHLAPWTEENGYYPAGTYVDGGVTDSLGGGICQVSSTLYNALLLAEIEIVERYPHSMSVGYVPLAADAALAGDYKDLVFKNNTEAAIYIDATYTEGSISFDVYGYDTREEGRTVKYVSETISTKKIKTEVEKDKTKSTDYEEVVEEGHTGYVAKLWKYVYQDGEEVDKILVNTSNYRMSPKKVIRGTKKEKDKDKNKNEDKKDDGKDSEEGSENSNGEAETTEKPEENVQKETEATASEEATQASSESGE